MPRAITKYREAATSYDSRVKFKAQLNLASALEHAGRTSEAWKVLKSMSAIGNDGLLLSKKLAALEKIIISSDSGQYQDRMPASQHMIVPISEEGVTK